MGKALILRSRNGMTQQSIQGDGFETRERVASFSHLRGELAGG